MNNLRLINGSCVEQEVDVIVNAANTIFNDGGILTINNVTMNCGYYHGIATAGGSLYLDGVTINTYFQNVYSLYVCGRLWNGTAMPGDFGTFSVKNSTFDNPIGGAKPICDNVKKAHTYQKCKTNRVALTNDNKTSYIATELSDNTTLSYITCTQ